MDGSRIAESLLHLTGTSTTPVSALDCIVLELVATSELGVPELTIDINGFRYDIERF